MILVNCIIHYDPMQGSTFNTYFQRAAENKIKNLVRNDIADKRSINIQTVSLDTDEVYAAVEHHLATNSAEELAIAYETVREREAELRRPKPKVWAV